MKKLTGFKYFLFIITVFPFCVAAQKADPIVSKEPDSTYIEDMSEYLSPRLSMNDNIKNFIVRNTVTYELYPNDNTVLKLSLNYRWLSLSYSNAPKFFAGNDDDTLKGTTKITAFAVNMNFNHWMQHLAYDRVKGYYLANTSAYLNPWQQGKDPYIQFPELVYSSFSGNTGYKFNKNFSFNSISAQTERQLKSAGTFIPSLLYNYYIVDDKTQLTGQNSSQKSNNLEVLLVAGYFYTLVINKQLYVTAGAAPGFGFIKTKLLTRLPAGNETSHFTNPILRLETGLAAGYNGERFFAGIQLAASAEAYNQNKTINVIESDDVMYQVFAGYRLRAPAFLRKAIDKVDKEKAYILKNK